MSGYKTLDQLNDSLPGGVRGKRVLVRVDFNVPIKDGLVTDRTRIARTVPTIRDLANAGARVVLMSHMGRPKGEPNPAFSLQQILPALEHEYGMVAFEPDCIGDKVAAAIDSLQNGHVLLLENLRFYPGEEKNDIQFVKELAALGDVYVNDAFATAHRAHASTEGVAHLLPAFAGRTMEAELKALEAALSAPEHPVVAVVGGAKVSTKLDLLDHLMSKVDQIVIGGGMANTFLAAQGHGVGKSLCEHDLLDTARKVLNDAQSRNCRLILPGDVVVAGAFKAGAPSRVCGVGEVGSGDMILDIGPASVSALGDVFGAAKTVLWNGPLGAFEIKPFDQATVEAALIVARLTRDGRLISVAGGGDTVSALNHAGAAGDFTYVSTAGGAFLEWLEGKDLPGVKALQQA